MPGTRAYTADEKFVLRHTSYGRKQDQDGNFSYPIFSYNTESKEFEPTGGFTPYVNTNIINPYIDDTQTYSGMEVWTAHSGTGSGIMPKAVDAGAKEWGAADISAKDFIDEEGNPRPLVQVAQILDPKLPGITGDELMSQIEDMAPKYQSIGKELAEKKGFAKEAMKGDVYGVVKEARKLGAGARKSMAGGMGGGMRAKIGGAGDIKAGFGATQRAYREDIYGLEKGAAKEYEADIQGFLDESWFVTPEKPQETHEWGEMEGALTEAELEEHLAGNAREGGYVHKDRSGIGSNRKFNDKTFLDVLTKLPDAGGS